MWTLSSWSPARLHNHTFMPSLPRSSNYIHSGTLSWNNPYALLMCFWSCYFTMARENNQCIYVCACLVSEMLLVLSVHLSSWFLCHPCKAIAILMSSFQMNNQGSMGEGICYPFDSLLLRGKEHKHQVIPYRAIKSQSREDWYLVLRE